MDALQLANTAFAVDMFKKLCEKDKTANIIFSPLCTSTSLALAYKATKGDTADQMKQVRCQHSVLWLQNYMAAGGAFVSILINILLDIWFPCKSGCRPSIQNSRNLPHSINPHRKRG